MKENNLNPTAQEITEKCIREILLAHNIDLDDPNFKRTPERAARAFSQFLRGYEECEITQIFRSSFPSKLKEMLIVRAIPVYSLCPHHLLPVEMRIWVGCIPNGKVLGLSKFRRLVKVIGQKSLLQEELTEIIADKILENLKPLGVMVVIDGHHMCMCMRGIEHENAQVTTSAVRGSFKEHEARAEFLNLIGVDRK